MFFDGVKFAFTSSRANVIKVTARMDISHG
ncbi:hypothetical protein D918_03553 [Trichuris suis]|nr:hypothetical protein D918_03553 [Trichuris suis]